MKSLEELKAIRERMQGEIGVRKADANETRVVVGMATCGIASGARPVLNRLAELVREKGLNDVIVTQAGCIGLCQYEPIVEVFAPGKEKVTYIKMTPEKAEEVVEQHLMRGLILAKYTLLSGQVHAILRKINPAGNIFVAMEVLGEIQCQIQAVTVFQLHDTHPFFQPVGFSLPLFRPDIAEVDGVTDQLSG